MSDEDHEQKSPLEGIVEQTPVRELSGLSAEQLAVLNGARTDQELIREYYKILGRKQHVVVSEDFINESKDYYGDLPWLAREVLQDFLDQNENFPGTINGVSMGVSEEGEEYRFRIEGPWIFENPSPLVSPDSNKPKDRKTAGGNGIGLKQVAIIYFRDKGVSKFEVSGTDWTINYNMVRSEEVNRALEHWGVERRVRKDWLCGLEEDAELNLDRCSYNIVTTNRDVVDSLLDIPNIAVGDKNPFLQNPDYESEFGSIVWHLDDPEKGRIFINGQVMGHASSRSAEHYWGRLEGVSIRLNDTDYDMSVDRPPISDYGIQRYMEELVENMDLEDTIDQIDRARFVWEDYHKRPKLNIFAEPASLAVVEKLAEKLAKSKDYDNGSFAEVFGDKLVAHDKITSDQLADLEGQGFVMCPESFASIGAPRASELIRNRGRKLLFKPNPDNVDHEQIARSAGITVGYDSSQTFEQALLLLKQMGGEIESVNGTGYRIFFDEEVDHRLASHPLLEPEQGKREQELVYALRTLVGKGLEERVVRETGVFTGQGGIVTTYKRVPDEIQPSKNHLWARNTIRTESIREGTYIRLTTKRDIESIWGAAPLQELVEEQPTPEVEEDPRGGLASRGDSIADKVGREGITGDPGSETPSGTKAGGTTIKLSEDAVVGVEPRPESDDPINEVYELLREGGSPYKAPSVSGSGRDMDDIVGEYHSSGVLPRQSGEETTEIEIARITRSGKPSHVIENFQHVADPTPSELAQLELIRERIRIATGYEAPNIFFLYSGNGVLGVNTKDADIGFHRNLMDVGLHEVYDTGVHEVVHNRVSGHGLDFLNTIESLQACMDETLSTIALKQQRGDDLSRDELYLVNTPVLWEQLRVQAREERAAIP